MDSATAKRTELANALAASIFQSGEAWVTSAAPGSEKCLRLEVLPQSRLPDLLVERYRMTRGGESQRFVLNAIETELLDAKGRLVRKTTHPGLVTVAVWFLDLP